MTVFIDWNLIGKVKSQNTPFDHKKGTKLMAQAHFHDLSKGGGSVVTRVVGMHAPKRPDDLQNWLKSACKALKIDFASIGKWECVSPENSFPMRIVFQLDDIDAFIMIDRQGNALGRN